ncbi:MAG TPA: hypothetical protein VFJ52_00980, partial [Terriglobia bacterium]|nr:hypothetical protein [Terriglobia bacterium]
RPMTSGIPSSIAVRNCLPRTRLLRRAGYQKPRIRPSLFEFFAVSLPKLSVITLANIADIEKAKEGGGYSQTLSMLEPSNTMCAVSPRPTTAARHVFVASDITLLRLGSSCQAFDRHEKCETEKLIPTVVLV